MFDEYIGIDLHKAFFQACGVLHDGTRVWEARFANDAEGITAFLARCAACTTVAIEASSPSWAFMDRLAGQVAQVQVIDPRKTWLRAGVAAKTDKLDALRRDSVAAVYYPPPARRADRCVMRVVSRSVTWRLQGDDAVARICFQVDPATKLAAFLRRSPPTCAS
jgi:transposase